MFKQKIKTTILLPVLWLSLVIILGVQLVQPVHAATPAGCPGGPAGPPSAGTVCPDGSTPVPDPTLPLGCPGSAQQGPVASTYTVQCPARAGREACTYSKATNQCLKADGQNAMPGGSSAPTSSTTPTSSTPSGASRTCTAEPLTPANCWIVSYVVDAINILSGLVGVVIVIMIAVGGLQYSSARDNPQATQAAKDKIRNAILALVLFIFGTAFLQYLVPGGIFHP